MSISCLFFFPPKYVAFYIELAFLFYFFTSGSPATDVSSDRIPASSAALPTMIQLTSPMTADVPMVATAVCATVLIARMPEAFSQSLM